MPKSDTIRAMISSRCATDITYQGKTVPLSEVRRDVKKDVVSATLWPKGRPLFECWINEDGASAPMDQTWWDHCLRQARQADIVIVLYNGESGGGIKGEPMGICHSELEAALARQSAKVRGIELPMAPLSADPDRRKRDEAFRKYVGSLDIFRGALAKTGEEVIERVRQELQQAVADMVQRCALTPDLAKSNTGVALEWHRMTYEERATAMRQEVAATLLDRPDTQQPDPKRADVVSVKLDGKQLLVQLHAVPAAFLTARRARESRPALPARSRTPAPANSLRRRPGASGGGLQERHRKPGGEDAGLSRRHGGPRHLRRPRRRRGAEDPVGAAEELRKSHRHPPGRDRMAGVVAALWRVERGHPPRRRPQTDHRGDSKGELREGDEVAVTQIIAVRASMAQPRYKPAGHEFSEVANPVDPLRCAGYLV